MNQITVNIAESKDMLENKPRLIETKNRIVVRTPVIPHFNNGNELACIKAYCNEQRLSVEFLPYHEYGLDKRQTLQNKM